MAATTITCDVCAAGCTSLNLSVLECERLVGQAARDKSAQVSAPALLTNRPAPHAHVVPVLTVANRSRTGATWQNALMRLRMSSTGVALFLGGGALAFGCTPVNISIPGFPRACMESPIPPSPPVTPTPVGYPTTWPNAKHGYDIVLVYEPADTKADFRVVQQVRFVDWVFTGPDCGASTIPDALHVPSAALPLQSHGQQLNEMFDTNSQARDPQWWFFPADSVRAVRVADGNVAYVPASRLPPPVPGNADITAWWNGLTGQTKADFEAAYQNGIFARYEYTYEFDYCHATPATFCGSRHCLDIEWDDVNNGKVTRRGTRRYKKMSRPPQCGVNMDE